MSPGATLTVSGERPIVAAWVGSATKRSATSEKLVRKRFISGLNLLADNYTVQFPSRIARSAALMT